MGLTTFWPLSQWPKIGHLGDDASGDFSKIFGRLHFKLPQANRTAKWTPENYLMCHSTLPTLRGRSHRLPEHPQRRRNLRTFAIQHRFFLATTLAVKHRLHD